MSEDPLYPERIVTPQPGKTFRVGDGRISGYLAVFLGSLSLLAVLCYRFPEYLTTRELRASYDAVLLQKALKIVMFASLVFGLLTFVLAKKRRMGAIGVLLTALAFAFGGYKVPTGPVAVVPLSFGLDWMLLAFLVSAMLFIFLEKVFPKYPEQNILRPEWGLDLIYFCINHLLITVLLLVGNYFVVTVFGWAVSDQLQSWLQARPIWVQVLILIVCADFVLYWSHRMFHEVPALWKIHAVHHSVESMDWMAGSRNHFIQTFVDRCLALVPLYLLGASKSALDIYVAFAAFQAVFVHANVGIPFGPLKYLIATPQFHHWHHSSQKPAIDTNYAVHSPLFDWVFGTYHMPKNHWPAHYGTTKPLPKGFWAQTFYPFKSE